MTLFVRTKLSTRWRAAGRVRRVLFVGAALVVSFVLAVSALSAAWLAGYKVPLASGATYLRVQKLAHAGDAERSGGPNKPFFVLLVGNDSRPGVGGARGDALHLVGVNPQLHQATILDIPRDTCWAGDKINAANAAGGGPAQAAGGRRPDRRADLLRRRRRLRRASRGSIDGVGGVEHEHPVRDARLLLRRLLPSRRAAPRQHGRRSRSRATGTTSRRATSSARTTRAC